MFPRHEALSDWARWRFLIAAATMFDHDARAGAEALRRAMTVADKAMW